MVDENYLSNLRPEILNAYEKVLEEEFERLVKERRFESYGVGGIDTSKRSGLAKVVVSMSSPEGFES